jgi:hypothetical protein
LGDSAVEITRFAAGRYQTAGVTEYSTGGSDEDHENPGLPLPENLIALVGVLQSPADMGRDHDK